jgi:diguanylate cyclase (GGDEF)-like protein/PAS domain S-box-containing protein
MRESKGDVFCAAVDGGVDLHAAIEDICAQLCGVVAGDFGVRIETASEDETAHKLVLLANFVLDVARRGIEPAIVARLGTWWHDLSSDTLSMSDEMLDLLSLDPAGSKVTRETILALVHRDDRDDAAAAFSGMGDAGGVERQEWRVRRHDGGFTWLWSETRLELNSAGEPVAVRGVCQDVTERRATADRIHKLAHYDTLTDVANRVLLTERLTQTINRAQRADEMFAVLCLDLDGFKVVNDLHGHAAGDRLLREVAARLRRGVRACDTVARLGGDEFVVLQDSPLKLTDPTALAERLLALLAEPYDIATDGLVAVTASFGIALFPAHGEDGDTLLHNADTAMYQAKRAGKNVATLFRSEMDDLLRARRVLEHDLRLSLARREFSLDWQPIAQAGTMRVTGFEALLRWHHPERGIVMPSVFVPVAEGCGLIGGIGAWVMHEACRVAAGWTTPLRVAVNISPLQVQHSTSFAAMVEEALANSGLAPERLELEITEGVLIREPERMLAVQRRLKTLGVGLALDDFGTGYSSLATLQAFPFDRVKIDRCFIAGVEKGERDLAIVRAVLVLAGGLGLSVVAEGVETDGQLAVLRAEGCDEVQGYLIGRPARIEHFARLTGGGSD